MSSKIPNLIIAFTAIIAIVIIEIEALRNSIDGKGLALAFLIIGGLGGYTLDVLKDKIKSFFKAR